MATRPLPPQEFLRECFRYDPETGEVWWRTRPDHHFPAPNITASWNTRFAGTRTFTTPDREGYKHCELIYEGSRYRLTAGRVIWKMVTGEEPEMVDHRDLDTGNNRFKNLRASDKISNRANAPGMSSSPFPKGVCREKGRFAAKGKFGGKIYRLGRFSTPAEAHAAYCAWARPLHGEFFNPGPPKPTVFD